LGLEVVKVWRFWFVDNVVVLDKSDLGFLTNGGCDCRLKLEGVVEVLGIRISRG
jgi:hypothetical protein